jgi:hypothetical protein
MENFLRISMSECHKKCIFIIARSLFCHVFHKEGDAVSETACHVQNIRQWTQPRIQKYEA